MQATVSFHCLKWASVKPEFKQREQGSNIDVNYKAPLLADLNFFFMKKSSSSYKESKKYLLSNLES